MSERSGHVCPQKHYWRILRKRCLHVDWMLKAHSEFSLKLNSLQMRVKVVVTYIDKECRQEIMHQRGIKISLLLILKVWDSQLTFISLKCLKSSQFEDFQVEDKWDLVVTDAIRVCVYLMRHITYQFLTLFSQMKQISFHWPLKHYIYLINIWETLFHQFVQLLLTSEVFYLVSCLWTLRHWGNSEKLLNNEHVINVRIAVLL